MGREKTGSGNFDASDDGTILGMRYEFAAGHPGTRRQEFSLGFGSGPTTSTTDSSAGVDRDSLALKNAGRDSSGSPSPDSESSLGNHRLQGRHPGGWVRSGAHGGIGSVRLARRRGEDLALGSGIPRSW